MYVCAPCMCNTYTPADDPPVNFLQGSEGVKSDAKSWFYATDLVTN